MGNSWVWTGVLLIGAYLIVTKTTLLSGLKNLGMQQMANAQPQMMMDNSGMMMMVTPTPAAMNNAVVPASMNNAVVPAAGMGKMAAPRKANNMKAMGKMAAPRNANNKVANMPAAMNNAAAAGGMFTTGSGQALKSTVNNAALLAMGVSSAGCPAGGVKSGGRNCYTLPGRHHCCPGKPSPAGSPSNAAGQTPCECDV